MFKHMNAGKKFVLNSHHAELCEVMEDVAAGRSPRTIVNIAPRFGKTEIVVKMFIAWTLAKNPSALFIHLTYSADLALDNSDYSRDIVRSSIYSQLWPDTVITQKSDSKKKWYTTAGGGVYATAAGSAVTGFGAGTMYDNFEDCEDAFFNGCILIDDPIKPDDAKSPIERNKVNTRYRTTIKNRINHRNTPIVVIGQRLDADDLSGYLLEHDADKWRHIKFPVLDENGVALWPYKLTAEEAAKERAEDADLFETQKQQNPDSKTGALWSNGFKTYNVLPEKVLGRKNQTDVADGGGDWLASVNYITTNSEFIYVTDVVYNNEGGEVTEPLVGELLNRESIAESVMESNGGGKAYARAIKKLVTDTVVRAVHQSAHKESKILTNAPRVAQRILFPSDWMHRWPVFYTHLTRFKKEFRSNEHDDAADVLTEIVIREKISKRKTKEKRVL